MFVGKEKSKLTRGASLHILVLLALCLGPTRLAHGQAASSTGVSPPQSPQKEIAAEARQKKMETDAAKLVELAEQLKISVDKTNKDVLSVDVVNRAAQLEKLAHEARDGLRQ